MSRWMWLVLLPLGGPVAQARFHAALNTEGKLVIAEQPGDGLQAFDPLRARPATGKHAPEQSGTEAANIDNSTHRLFAAIAQESGVDVGLLHAVARQESNYNPRALSVAGAAGLMQLMPATARRFGVRDRFDAAQNLRGGAAYLAWLLRRFNNDLDLALAAYNAGEGAVQRHGNRVPPYAETRNYVRRVRDYYDQLPSAR